jgi:EpsI family protein
MEIIWKSKYIRLLTIALILQATLFYSASHGDSRVLQQPLRMFPETLPGWQMLTQGIVEPGTLEVLKADDVLARFYVPTGRLAGAPLTREQKDAITASAIDFFVAYFSTQQSGQSPHSPKNCLPGSGWQPIETGEIAVPIAGLSAPITINKYVIEKGDSQSMVLYWYQSHGRVVANEFAAKFYLVADSLRYHRSDTALVRVVIPVNHGDLGGAEALGTNFVQAVYPSVYRFLPM